MKPRIFLVAMLALALVATGAPTASALSSTSGDAGPNFNESRGCGDGQMGTRSPYVGDTGVLPSSTRVYGPKADFFGRSWNQLDASMLNNHPWDPQWGFPDSNGPDWEPRLHERLLPALDRVRANIVAEQAAGNSYNVYDMSDWVFRTVGGKEYLSNHAMGNAWDINPQTNPYRSDNRLITDMPEWFRDAWRDAGFCWGGDWVQIKDTMHYSWMGPLATDGYGVRPGPYPPINSADPAFTERVDVPMAYGDTPDPLAMADRSRDGADDLYRVRAAPDGLVVEAAGARSHFGVVGYRVRTGLAVDPSDTALADFDGDARADLVVFDHDTNVFRVYSDKSHFTEVVATGPFPAAASELAFGHADFDWTLDLFAVSPGPTTMIAVFTAASGYSTGPSGTLSGADMTGWAFALGDYSDAATNPDGLDDLYAVERSSGSLVVAKAGGGGFTESTLPATDVVVGDGQLLIGDYDGDGRKDLYVADDGRLKVHLAGVPLDPISRWFLPDDPASWDAGPECVGDKGCPQIGFVDSGGEWSVKDEPASEADDVAFFFGNPNDVPFAGDWDGDGVETPGLYRQSDGYVYLRNSSDEGVADVSFFFGNPGDVPVVGDFDGDGDDTVSLYRPSEQRFYIINELGSGDGGLGAAETDFSFGDPGDKPVAGDFDGNGVDDVALHRESTGLIYYRLELTTGIAHDTFIFGNPGDVILTGDWDGDGADTLVAYRPADGDWYIKLDLSDGFAEHIIHYHDHDGGMAPVVGAFGTDSRTGT